MWLQQMLAVHPDIGTSEESHHLTTRVTAISMAWLSSLPDHQVLDQYRPPYLTAQGFVFFVVVEAMFFAGRRRRMGTVDYAGGAVAGTAGLARADE